MKDTTYFLDQLDQFQEALRSYFHGRGQETRMPPDTLETLWEEYRTVVEELMVAHEELEQSYEMLQEAQQKIEEQRDRYQHLFQHSPDAYLETNEDGVILVANEQAGRMLGVKSEELVGKPLATYVELKHRQDFRTQLYEVAHSDPVSHSGLLDGTEPIRWETRIKPRRKISLDAQLTVGRYCQRSEGEHFCTLRWIVRDITRRKQAEREVQQSKDELEKRVLDRTAELAQANEGLSNLAEKLRRSNKELEQFAFIASHDLQEPLRKIESFGQLLDARARQKLDKSERDYLQRMRNAAIRMRVMVDDLLALSQIGFRGKPFEEVGLNQVISSVLADLDFQIEQLDAEITVGDLPPITGDPTQIRQLIQNLISNSLKFAKPGEKPIVRLYAERSQDGMIELLVQDQGIGFDDTFNDKIFEPFQRLVGQSEYEGAGMGLAICKKIVERHSGTITAKSAPGKGAIFIITFPSRNSE